MSNPNARHSETRQNRLMTSYILWLGAMFGLAGLHRFYNGKIATGVLWLSTWGLFGIGQFIDLFLVPEMVEDRQMKLMLKYGMSLYGVPTQQPAIAAETVTPPTKEQLMVKLLRAAQENHGRLTVTQGVMATELSFSEVENLLKDMHKAGYVGIDNHSETGCIVYQFYELQG